MYLTIAQPPVKIPDCSLHHLVMALAADSLRAIDEKGIMHDAFKLQVYQLACQFERIFCTCPYGNIDCAALEFVIRSSSFYQAVPWKLGVVWVLDSERRIFSDTACFPEVVFKGQFSLCRLDFLG